MFTELTPALQHEDKLPHSSLPGRARIARHPDIEPTLLQTEMGILLSGREVEGMPWVYSEGQMRHAHSPEPDGGSHKQHVLCQMANFQP